MRPTILSLCLLCAACAAPPVSQDPGYFSPRHAATSAATKDCGGPWLNWSVVIEHTPWPYRTYVTETMRCMTDGRVVGPYTYRSDGI